MRREWLRCSVLAILMLGARDPVFAQRTLRGVVVGDSGVALAGAIVDISQLHRTASADGSGAFEFAGISPGKYRILARAIGYRPRILDIRVQSTDVTRIVLKLDPMPVTLDPLTVEAPAMEAINPLAGGFAERRRALTGHFLGPDELLARENTDLSGLLRLFGVPIRTTRRMNRPYAAGRSGRTITANGTCPAQVFLDGNMISNQLDTFDLSTVRVPNLAGLEYYESEVRVPIQFSRGDFRCGVLVLWTRLRKP